MPGSVILSGARTPIGKLSGSLAGFKATELGAIAIKEALVRAGVSPDGVDYVFMGQVLQAGAGQITARQAAVGAGIPMTVPATTVNKVCLSGINTIMLADLLIQSGQAEIVVAGGMESMTNAPYLLPDARGGMRMGDKSVVDSMMHDGLFCAIDQLAMGGATEKYAASAGLGREEQDDLAAKSHERAARAQKDGLFDNEIVNVEIPQRKGDPVIFSTDEGVRGETTLESLGKLRPAFDKAGNITAGNASQISDGAGALLVTTSEIAAANGWTPMARVHTVALAGDDPVIMLTGPIAATQKALERSGLKVSDIGAYEVNEAFAPVPMAWQAEIGASDDVLNPVGGAISVGHPLGGSGAILMTRLVHHMRDNGIQYGLQTMCEAGGMANATILELL